MERSNGNEPNSDRRTPGPWTCEPDLNDLSCFIKADVGGRQVAVAAAHSYTKKSIDRKTRNANARLIAAAPDLLDALKALRANVDKDMSGFWTESTANFMQQADAAIAKAEGQ